MTNTPETIYLIPGEDGLVWCDDPAPDKHCDPAEAVKYVRADVHQAIIDRQAKVALMGMDAAKRGAEIMERDAKRMLAESNPDVIDSERAANARLTQELEQAQARVADAIRCLETVSGKAELGASVVRAERTEVMDHVAEGFDVIKKYAKSEAARLRQQADEAEQTGG